MAIITIEICDLENGEMNAHFVMDDGSGVKIAFPPESMKGKTHAEIRDSYSPATVVGIALSELLGGNPEKAMAILSPDVEYDESEESNINWTVRPNGD